jgi:hypothetical protein
MISRALCALTVLLGGCTIHVVEQPASPVVAGSGPAVVVANAPEARPTQQARRPRPAASAPTANEPAPGPEPPRAAAPPRSELTAHRPPTKPRANEPLYTPFRSVGSTAASTPMSNVPPASKHELRKVKKTGT